MTREEWLQRYLDRWTARGYLLSLGIEKYASVFDQWSRQYAGNPEAVADLLIKCWEGEGDRLNAILADHSGSSRLSA